MLLNVGSANDKHGVRERFAKYIFLFAKNGLSRAREIWLINRYVSIFLSY